MAEGRFLSRSIATDAQLAQLSETAELLYLKVIPHLDRDGMISGEPLALLGIISPLRFSQLQSKIACAIDEWVAVGLVTRFATASGSSCLFFKGFLKQQKLKYERERPSKYPAPPGYVRTETGLKLASAVPWVENSGLLTKNPDQLAYLRESGAQQQQQQQQEQQQQQQQQATAPATPDRIAAAAGEEECRDALRNFGIPDGSLQDELVRLPVDDVLGWIAYAEHEQNLRNRVGYVVKQLRAGLPPPPLRIETHAADDSYEALKRKYLPVGWEDIIEH